MDRAEGLLDDGQRKAMELLRRLDETRGELMAEKEAASRAAAELRAETERIRAESERMAAEHGRLAARLDAEVRSALKRNRLEQEELKREVRRSLSENRKVDPVATALSWSRLEKNLAEARPEPVTAAENVPLQQAGVGDDVLVASLGSHGRVDSADPARDEYVVSVGPMTVRVGLRELMRPLPRKKRPDDGHPDGTGAAGKITLSAGPVERVTEINLIGRTVAEAEAAIDRELDRAAMIGQETLTIIHGLGTGRLKSGIVEHLRGHPLVKGYFHPTNIPGGAGVTEVTVVTGRD
jgi:DNA mismatch repair protein MutS2